MNEKHTQRIQKIDRELERWLPENPDSLWAEQVFTKAGIDADAESMRSLVTPLRELVFRGGKRWRPLLMTLVCEMVDNAANGEDTSIPLTPVVEFSHNASLIHDDIEDESDERRGNPAVHKLYGVDTAINSASFLYFLASCCIDNYSPASASLSKETVYKLWMECMRRLHLGQAMDIRWHRDVAIIPKLEEYFLMCKMKTGSLARLSAELGALAGGAALEEAKVFGDAADNLGVGFQILDDVKNLTTGVPGKKKGDDIVEGKKGYPVLLYMHKFPEKRERIFYGFHVAKREGMHAPEVSDLIDILEMSGVFPEAEEKGRSLLEDAKKVFSSSELAGLINLMS